MRLAPVDLNHIAQRLAELGEDVCDRHAGLDAPPDVDPRILLEAFWQLLDALEALSHPQPEAGLGTCARERALTQHLAHGLDLLEQLAALARTLQLPTHARHVTCLALPLSCWVLRQGGELLRPAPLVDATAGLANTTVDIDELRSLHRLISEILDGVGAERLQDPAGPEAAQAWQVLIYNRAIVATRTQHPALMRAAFDALVELVPELAPGFFREGMEQMETRDYPAQVRALMQTYYSRWGRDPGRLH
ncbi:hypothetical protein [Marichromatium bheemlicum]|uniref:Uncharacterized protein n=1 Tax=Marichromatium bheemlicum TaxID=365339 RepID=A0ABX1I846_9GAMM|nr:hypothetical protein [Marichromatium bheemlicum]NKN33346.1 hypothetical protein [Marichromatium bheemlicum]